MRERLGLSEADVERVVDDEATALTVSPASVGGGAATKAKQAASKKKKQEQGKRGRASAARLCVRLRVSTANVGGATWLINEQEAAVSQILCFHASVVWIGHGKSTGLTTGVSQENLGRSGKRNHIWRFVKPHSRTQSFVRQRTRCTRWWLLVTLNWKPLFCVYRQVCSTWLLFDRPRRATWTQERSVAY